MPTTQLQLRRGNTAQTAIFTGAVGEVTVDTDKDTLIVHDGVTQGGIQLARQDYANAAFHQANNANSTASDAYQHAGSASSYANSAYGQANTGIILAQAAFNTANNAVDTWVRIAANSASSYANSAFHQANNANSTASDAYQHAGSASSYANGAFAQANTGTILAQAAFGAANSSITYTNNAIANLVNSAPITLDTLNELAAALGDDANFSTTITTMIGVTGSYANSAYVQANTGTILAQAAFNKANTYTPDRLVNGNNNLVLESTGTIKLPANGTISEGIVTSNPTIQLTPANPDVASQKLVIKGGGAYSANTNNIYINYYSETAIVGDTLNFYVNSETYADQTLYWWIHPTGANTTNPDFGTVALVGPSGSFSFIVDSVDYEFTVRVSPINNQYNLASIGVESGIINSSAPTFTEHHLHLTTGDLTETSIFLGTDNHNVRTTTNGNIQITTSNTVTNVWDFGTDGSLTFPDETQQYTAYTGLVGSETLTTNTANQVIDSYSTTEYRTAKYIVQAISGADVHSEEILVTHNDTDVFFTEYASLTTANILFNVYATIQSSNVTVNVSPINTETQIDFSRISIIARTLAMASLEGDLMSLSGTEDLETGSGTVDLMA
jgi:hypothetical protein